jgi:hypothetical protein
MGIMHQVNIEYLARVVETDGDWVYPDVCLGTDSHTTMVNGLGVLGWGIGGIEAEAVMLGQSLSLVVPPVVGFRLIGELPPGTTATDLVLTITELLRNHGVVGKQARTHGSTRDHHALCKELAGQALDLLKPRGRQALSWPLEQRPGGVVRQDDGANVGEALAQVVTLRAFVGGPHVHPEPVGALIGGAGAGPVQQFGAQALTAVRAVDCDVGIR